MSEKVHAAISLNLPKNKKIDIEFEDITYAVSNGRKGKKYVLKGLSGKFKAGELTAIMGPSGAGKTTLLNMLTGFQSQGMKGIIKSSGFTGEKSGSKQYKKESCYILQDDQLVPFFTVFEIMNMCANLKLPKNFSDKVKECIINEIFETLGLTSCKDTRCGQLSGGQKKRLSIALELVNNPPVMFLDEPTSGLDSSSSLQCISVLKTLARGGRTIICTIHQPSASIYDLFDHVYVIADGQCIYKGASSNTVPYLSSVGLHCPEYHNPADYLLEVANGEYGCVTEHLSKTAKELNWRNVFSTSRLQVDEQQNGFDDEYNSSDFTTNTPPTEWNKFLILINRSFLQLYRDWTVTHLKLILHTLIGIFIGVFYLNSGNDASKTMSNFGYLLISCAYLCYTSIIPAVVRFPAELPVLKKERFNNWYDLKTYYLANMVADIPMQILFCISYATISYFMSAQPSEVHRYLMFIVMCCLVTIVAESVGIFLGTLVNPINGTFLAAVSVAFMLILAGFLVFLTHMSAPFYYLSYVSYLRYGLQGLVYAIYGQGRETIPCPEDVLYCHYTTPSIFLKEIGMANIDYWSCVGMLCAIFVFLRMITYCTLKRKVSSG